MNKAIGIVLLPSDEVIDLCIDINKEAFKHDKGRFQLSKDYIVPHISLAIGCCSEEDIADIIEIVKEVSNNQKPLHLNLEKFDIRERHYGKRVIINIGITDEVQKLHQKIINSVSDKYIKYESPDMLAEGDITGISKSSNKVINNFYDLYSNQNYNPHITLSCLEFENLGETIKFPVEFMSNKIAIFQLGDGCTCRKLIDSFSLC